MWAMKKLFTFGLFAFLLISCKKETASTTSTKQDSTTVVAPIVTPPISKGSVQIIAKWQVSYPYTLCSFPYKVTIGSGYTSNDVKLNTFFSSKVFRNSIPQSSGGITFSQSATLDVSDLDAGTYYFKAIKESNDCTVKGQTDKTVQQLGSFKIEAGKTKVINTSLL